MIAFDEIETVPICVRCGRGFTPSTQWPDPSIRIDAQPVWWTQSETGRTCGGRVMDVPRRGQIEQLDDEEFYRGAWSQEQFAQMTATRTRGGDDDVES